jgi:hypothetical protein
MVFDYGWFSLGVGVRIGRRLVVLKIVVGKVLVVEPGFSEVLRYESMR